jgi:hypothetical protein
MRSAGICQMCGHHVGVRQKAHILAEGKKTENNVLMLCPTCHVMFDTHVKPKVFKAMMEVGLQDFPESCSQYAWPNQQIQRTRKHVLCQISRAKARLGRASRSADLHVMQ